MRLIDADELIKNIKCSGYEYERLRIDTIIECLLTDVVSPTIDPIHFAGGTYCKECIYKEESTVKNPKDYWCQLRDSYMGLDGFCSEGRKDDMKNE